ncbi:hypothetical protein [Pseudomonas sp.]|uniref:hypothetical protein n=1 Tax=Pseudomonas sp. TaxID=306 RepID=UPI003C76620B
MFISNLQSIVAARLFITVFIAYIDSKRIARLSTASSCNVKGILWLLNVSNLMQIIQNPGQRRPASPTQAADAIRCPCCAVLQRWRYGISDIFPITISSHREWWQALLMKIAWVERRSIQPSAAMRDVFGGTALGRKSYIFQ